MLRPVRHLLRRLLRAAFPTRAPLLLALLLLLAPAAQAQSLPSLIADSLSVDGQTLVADGNVEVFYEGTRLSAARLTYRRETDHLTIDGPIFIETAEGEILTATRAELDPRLQNGLLLGARLVLDRRLQLAAAAIRRESPLSELTEAVATSCQVCAGRPPLWEIRAARVTHDEEARQLWFEEARFAIRGVPVAYIPRLRLPEPGVSRATGLLFPDIKTSDRLGIGLRLPYFIALGDSRDLTLTPYLSPATRTFEARYRQAFFAGTTEIRGAISDDDLMPGALRGYVMAELDLALGAWTLDGDLQLASDRAYLSTYGYSDADLLTSALRLSRIEEDRMTRAEADYFSTLRTDERQRDLPPVALSFSHERRVALSPVTRLDLGASADAFRRTGAGRDMARAGAWGALGTTRILPGGLVAEAEARLTADAYRIDDGPDQGFVTRAQPAAIATLRWPLIRASARATQTLEPIIALAWSETLGTSPPNEDSPYPELDEANLFALSRFPGEDATERGWRLAAGLAWTADMASGAHIRLTFGQILRPGPGQDPGAAFTASSGLAGASSDLLLASQLAFPSGLTLTARTLWDEATGFGKTGAEIDWAAGRVDLNAAYVWLPEDAGEGRAQPVAEWSLDAAYRINERWNIRLDGRYDIANSQPARAGVGLGWRNECVSVDFSLTRRYTSATAGPPVTDLGLSVSLDGFSTGATTPVAASACRG
ncbi:LPS-assembly protein LptD [Pseudoroseicyclus sp. CXY001]|uniref:LPS-assembly protein LptD n=1 Tax=Pseudoroseicyclus sp. CXY001 TaxID=3242492 RepID=UPI00358DAEFD